MKTELLSILRHSLGYDDEGNGTEYRNHFVTDPACCDGLKCEELCRLGLMRRRDNLGELTGGAPCYHVTDEGKALVNSNKPVPKKLTRSQARYQRFLDCDFGGSFGEWLRYKDTWA